MRDHSHTPRSGASTSRLSTQGLDVVVSAPSQRHSTYHCPPISTYGWDLSSIIARSPNFHPVKRVHYTAPHAKVDIALPEVERDGNPLIIHGWNRHPRWPKSLFNVDWLRKNGDQNPTVRNIHNWADFKIPMDDFIKKLRESPVYANTNEHERLYGKDGECPAEWTEWLLHAGAIPEDLLFSGSNDFLKFLPNRAKVQTLMCYMGIGDTFTPFHKDLCASSGQNLMCFSEHAGSAFWFMTKSSAVPQVAAYLHQLGQEIDLETHVITIEELEKAPFDVYIAEQHVGDLVLVPPRSCHQVINKGGITIKTSWSRMSLSGLQAALWHELPIYHRVCRQEIYKVKSNVFHALQHFSGLMEASPERGANQTRTSTENLKQLVSLFDDILASEFSISRDSMPHVSQPEISHADNLHCDFCGADIFQSFFECDSCLPASSSTVSEDILPVGDGLVLCPLCYVEGRTCHCEDMQPVQCRPFSGLLEIRDQAVKAIKRIDDEYTNVLGYISEQPLLLLSEGGTNIFEAACKLYQKRQNDAKTIRSCRVSHPVSAAAAIYCKTCHFSKCYTHLLESDSIHSVDAITLSERRDGDAIWHQSHRNSSQQYLAARQRAIQDEESGVRPNASHRLAYLAKTFTTCRAMAPEVTKHGWYDRFAQMATIPILDSPAKALSGPLDEGGGDESYDIGASDGSPNDPTGPAAQSDGHEISDPPEMMTSLAIVSSTSPKGINGVQPPQQSDLSAIPDPRSPVVDPTFPSSKLDISVYSPLSTLCSPSSTKEPFVVGSVFEDNPGDLSDLTDLPTENDSPPHNSVDILPVSNTLDSMDLARDSSPAPIASPNTQIDTRLNLRPRLVFDCVEIPRPEWYYRKIEKALSSRRKRKRVTDTLSLGVVGSPDSDSLLFPAHNISTQSLSKRKRKFSPGPASRLLRSCERTHSPNDANPQSQNNLLANALNQTFQLNDTNEASPTPLTPGAFDAISTVSNVIASAAVKPQYRDFGVQKNLNFTRRTSATQPFEELSGCIVRLESENHDLRAQAERYKRECQTYRDSLDEINKRYNSGPYQQQQHRVQQSGPSNFDLYPIQDSSVHPRWQTRNAVGDNRRQLRRGLEPDYPPIETLPLPTPSSPEVASAPLQPTEPRGFREKTPGDVLDEHVQSYYKSQKYSRRLGPVEPTDGRRRQGTLREPHSVSRHGRPAGSPTTPDSSVQTATTEGEVQPTP